VVKVLNFRIFLIGSIVAIFILIGLNKLRLSVKKFPGNKALLFTMMFIYYLDQIVTIFIVDDNISTVVLAKMILILLMWLYFLWEDKYPLPPFFHIFTLTNTNIHIHTGFSLIHLHVVTIFLS
jgi:hypothetical protein